MKVPSAKELAVLRQLASLRADRARADIARANARVEAIRTQVAALDSTPDATEPAAVLALEKWMLWRNVERMALNRELALARAHATTVLRDAARHIAREDALSVLIEDADREARRKARSRADETLTIKAPDVRYQ